MTALNYVAYALAAWCAFGYLTFFMVGMLEGSTNRFAAWLGDFFDMLMGLFAGSLMLVLCAGELVSRPFRRW